MHFLIRVNSRHSRKSVPLPHFCALCVFLRPIHFPGLFRICNPSCGLSSAIRVSFCPFCQNPVPIRRPCPTSRIRVFPVQPAHPCHPRDPRLNPGWLPVVHPVFCPRRFQPFVFRHLVPSRITDHESRLAPHSRFNALNTARTDASSIFVSTPAPQRVLPSGVLIWM